MPDYQEAARDARMTVADLRKQSGRWRGREDECPHLLMDWEGLMWPGSPAQVSCRDCYATVDELKKHGFFPTGKVG